MCFGNDVLVGDKESLGGNDETGACADGFAIFVLQNEEVHCGARLFGECAKVGCLIFCDERKGEAKKAVKERRGHGSSKERFSEEASPCR